MADQESRGMHFEAQATVDARPETVWDILTDYRDAHSLIIPPQFFSDYEVESGGRGAGTVIRFAFRVAGTKRHMRQVVSEPQPGRILVERDIDGPAHSTFTLTPVDGGRKTRVLITTDQVTRPGIAGAVERLLAPLLAPSMKRMYLQELSRLEALAQGRLHSAGAPAQ